MKDLIPILAAATFALAISANANADTQARILHFGCKPAAGAKVSVVVRRQHEQAFEKRDFTADAEGRVTLTESAINPRARIQSYFVIVKAKGAALGVWRHGLRGEVTLAPTFTVDGKVQTEAGTPVADAEVKVVHFGLSTYVSIPRHEMGGLTGFQTRTDKDGRYSLPGATLNGHDWPVGGMLNVTARIDGKLHTGALNQPYVSDSKFFDRENNNPEYFKHPGPVTVYPSGSIRGKVTDFLTDQPIADAEVSFYASWFPQEKTKTDERGGFVIRGAHRHAKRHLDVSKGNMPVVYLTEREKRGTPVNVTDLQIAMRPVVKVKGHLLDGGTQSALPMAMGITYEESVSPNSDQWIERYQRCPNHVKAAEDGTFECELPLGKNRLGVQPQRSPGFVKQPYESDVVVDVPNRKHKGANNALDVPLKRNPGVLFSTTLEGNPGLEERVWAQLIPRIAIGDEELKSSRVVKRHQPHGLWFQPVEAWGTKLALSMEFSNGKTRKILLPRADYAATKATPWPVEVRLPKP